MLLPRDDLSILDLDARVEPSVVNALDTILRAARSALVARGEHLDAVRERLAEETTRILLFAVSLHRPVGLIDVSIHHPAPGVATIGALAVAPDARFLGVGRALVTAAAKRCLPSCEETCASIRKWNTGALSFFTSLGFEIEGDPKGDLVSIRGATARMQ